MRLGEWNTATDPDCIENLNVSEKDCSDPPLDLTPEEVIPHPEFNSNNQSNNDIGLIRLSRDVDNTFFISPICLPTAQLQSQPGDSVMVSGWGRTLDSGRSAIKQKLQIEIADRDNCVQKFAAARRTIFDHQICAGGVFREDSCDGDSGGPLMKLVNDHQWFVEGIVSFGNRCGLEGWPAIYTRVNSFLDWISSNVRN